MGSFGHVIAGFLASVVFAFLALALSDGRSVVVVRGDKEAVFAATEIGPKYGVGVFHDARGYQWYEEGHAAYKCEPTRRIGKACAGFATVALVTNALLVLVHLIGAQRGGKLIGQVGAVGHVVSILALAALLGLATALYDRSYCGAGPLKDHFELTYGVPFVVVGIAVGILNVAVLFLLGATKDEEAAEGAADEKSAPDAIEPVAA